MIVPCFNQGEFAAECLASIEAQTHRNLRVAVIDDASTDGSGALLDQWASDRIRVVHLERNLGRALVRNEGVRLLGDDVDFVLNVDCDDRLSPEYVAKLLDAMRAASRAGLAYGTLVSFGERRDEHTSWPRAEYDHARRFAENRIPGPGTLFRAEALRMTGGWRAAFGTTGNEDADIWLQVVEKGWRPVWVRDATYHYRHHAGSFLSRSSEANLAKGWLAILAHHRAGIEATIGVDAFLEIHVMPWLRAAVRRGRLREALPALNADTLRLLVRYWLGRLRSRGARGDGR